jgi:hypothetical protein
VRAMTPPLRLYEPQPWRDHAACKGLTSLFFTERGESTREAKAVCAGCPVRAECMAFAVDNAERFGVWGGTTERQRRAARGWDQGWHPRRWRLPDQPAARYGPSDPQDGPDSVEAC